MISLCLSFQYNCTSMVSNSRPNVVKRTSVNHHPRGVRMQAATNGKEKENVVVIMGATGCGKTKLSIDLATVFGSEIINSDKMQVYEGLDVTTNKVPVRDRCEINHHLLGDINPNGREFTASDFRLRGGLVISDIIERRRLPIVVGGSNSFIHALLVDQFDPNFNVFNNLNRLKLGSILNISLRYRCCFIWIDVEFDLLCEYLSKRVDEMLETGMYGELMEYLKLVDFEPGNQPGLGKTIGVPEFCRFFKMFQNKQGLSEGWDEVRRRAFEEAVRETKENTCWLAKRQIEKIMTLRDAEGWDLHRVDATEALREKMMMSPAKDRSSVTVAKRGRRWEELWKNEVLESSVKVVESFLEERGLY